MSPKKFTCTLCSKDYASKSGLTAHIKSKHPLQPVEPEKKGGSKSNEPSQASKKNASKMTNLNTHQVDNLLAEEEEFYEAIDELEHAIGINESMSEWANINFTSSFGESGKFSGHLWSSFLSVMSVKQTTRQ